LIGFWLAELTHPYWEFVEQGYSVEIGSPKGGELQWDSWSDPRDASGYSAHDLLSLGFISSPQHAELLKRTPAIAELTVRNYDAVFLVGGQSPMVTMVEDARLHQFVADFYQAGKVVAVVCHATALLLKAKLSDGKLLVEGKTWTGFANSEERFADEFVGKDPALLD
jgi:putative intracellular protease/amidase